MIKKKPVASTATMKTASSTRTRKPTESSDSPKPKVGQLSINTVLKSKLKFKFRSVKQREFSDLIDQKEIVVAYGPAGTGKSLISIAKGLELLQADESVYKQLIIIKPAVEAEESLGFLKGSLSEKMEPHVASSMDIVDKLVGEATRINLVEAKIIRVEALSFVRGKTFSDSVLVFEESQNVSPNQMKTILTRIGENSKYIISGDLDQSDKYRNVRESGLYDLIQRHSNIEEIGFFEFNNDDIVRNPLITKILKNYDKVEPKIVKKELLVEDELLEKRVQKVISESKKVDKNKIIKSEPIIKNESVLGFSIVNKPRGNGSTQTISVAPPSFPIFNREKLNQEIVGNLKEENWLTKMFTSKDK